MAKAGVKAESSVTKAYLVAYNGVQSLGWFFVAVKLVRCVIEHMSFEFVYEAVGDLVIGLQLIAFLEVLHAIFGLVRSGPLTAFLQWSGRTHVLVAIISYLPEVQLHIGVFLTFAAWSLTEIIRYPQYGLSIVGLCPRWLTWMRYTLFIVLYPIGVFGEMFVMYAALDPIRRTHLFGNLFDHFPIGYDRFVIGLLVVYPFLFLMLYGHMFKQRHAKLGGNRRGARKTQKD